MRRFLLHLLPLACGLLLALPPGWCCLLGPCPARAAPAPAEPSDGAQCPCCCHPNPRPEPARPAPPLRCPCADRDATTPDVLKPPTLLSGDGLAALPAGADLELTASHDAPVTHAGPLSLSAPLNVLHCVWLC
jgi:hypothetical protein